VVCIQDAFESLFRQYDASAQFQYLRSFRRARVIFENLQSAAAAHQHLYNYAFNGLQIKCYYAQVGQSVCAQLCRDSDYIVVVVVVVVAAAAAAADDDDDVVLLSLFFL